MATISGGSLPPDVQHSCAAALAAFLLNPAGAPGQAGKHGCASVSTYLENISANAGTTAKRGWHPMSRKHKCK